MQSYQDFGIWTLVTLAPLGFLIAIVCGIWGKLRTENKSVWRFQGVGFFLISVGMVAFALTDIFAIHRSASIAVQGYVARLRQTQGKGHSSFFYVVNQEWSPQLTTDYSESRLQNGELIRAEYLSNTDTVTHLEVLSGPHAGWKLDEGDGTMTSLALILLGGIFLAVALVQMWPWFHIATQK